MTSSLQCLKREMSVSRWGLWQRKDSLSLLASANKTTATSSLLFPIGPSRSHFLISVRRDNVAFFRRVHSVSPYFLLPICTCRLTQTKQARVLSRRQACSGKDSNSDQITTKTSTMSDTDLNASFYRKHSDLQYGIASELLENYTFNPAAHGLDIGCGDGRITAKISTQIPNGKMVGIDASESMIDLAQTSFSRSEFPNLEFHQVKAEDLPLTDLFDFIISCSCFHWIRTPKKALELAIKLLKPGGELMMITYPKESPYYEFMQEALSAYPQYAHLSAYQTMLSIDEYRSILENKVTITEFEVKELIAAHVDKEAMKNFIRGWLTSFVPLPPTLQEEYLDLVVEKSLPYSKDMQNGCINLPYTALKIKARNIASK